MRRVYLLSLLFFIWYHCTTISSCYTRITYKFYLRFVPITQVLFENDKSLDLAADVILNGGVVCIPTDTVYGLAALAENSISVDKIFQIKERASGVPLPVLIGSFPQINQFTDKVNDLEKALASEFWPGALTLIVDKSSLVPENLTGNLSTVGCRIPDHAVPLAITNKINKGITGTSANKSGLPPATNIEEALEQFEDSGVDLIIDGGDSKSNKPSTIIECKDSIINIIREGVITREDIFSAISKHIDFEVKFNG